MSEMASGKIISNHRYERIPIISRSRKKLLTHTHREWVLLTLPLDLKFLKKRPIWQFVYKLKASINSAIPYPQTNLVSLLMLHHRKLHRITSAILSTSNPWPQISSKMQHLMFLYLNSSVWSNFLSLKTTTPPHLFSGKKNEPNFIWCGTVTLYIIKNPF